MPASVHLATVPASPKSTSSGWAATTRTFETSVSSGTAAILCWLWRPAAVAAGRAALVQGRHHVLDAGVVLEPVHRQVLAVPGALEAAVRHLGDQRDVRVDPDAAEVQPPRHPHGTPVVGGPDRGRKPVLGAVRPGDGLVFVGELLHGDDRPEHLVLNDLVVLLQPADDAGLVEVPARPLPVAAGQDPGVVGQPADEPGDPVKLVGVVERSVGGVLHIGAARDLTLGLLDQCVNELVVYPWAGQHPGGGCAVLARVEVAGDRD